MYSAADEKPIGPAGNDFLTGTLFRRKIGWQEVLFGLMKGELK